jgi:hypothetical protein
MPTGTAARKAPRFRRTHLCGQPEDRRGHRLAATIRASPIQLVGQFDIPYSPALAGGRSKQLEARMDEIAHRVARDRTNAARERTSTDEALLNQVQALEAQAKQTRFRKDIDVRAFAYHVR